MFRAPKQKCGKHFQQSSNTIKYIAAQQEKDNTHVCAPQELINQSTTPRPQTSKDLLSRSFVSTQAQFQYKSICSFHFL